MPPPQSSSVRASAAQASARSIAGTLALVRHTAEVRRLELEHMAAKARRIKREDEITQTVPSNSATFINVDYHFAMRELQAEAVRTRSHLSSMTNTTGREYAMHLRRVQRLSQDIEERQTFLTQIHFVKDTRWCWLYTEEYRLEREKLERGVKTLLRHCMSALAFCTILEFGFLHRDFHLARYSHHRSR